MKFIQVNHLSKSKFLTMENTPAERQLETGEKSKAQNEGTSMLTSISVNLGHSSTLRTPPNSSSKEAPHDTRGEPVTIIKDENDGIVSNSDKKSNIDSTTTSKTKRSTSTLSSSLRRLITLTFNRSSSSSTRKSGGTNLASTSRQVNQGRISYKQKSHKYKRNNDISGSSSSSRNNRNFSDVSSNASTLTEKGSLLNVHINPTLHQMNSDDLNNVKDTLPSNLTIARRSSCTTFQSNSDENNCSGKRQAASFNERISQKEGNATQEISSKKAQNKKQQSTWGSTSSSAEVPHIDGERYIECPLCVLLVMESSTPHLDSCNHRVCLECMQRYITNEINHSRLNITCPICSEPRSQPIHPNAIKRILQNEKYYLKYENFMLRRVLAAEPDARWCPAPDCGYVVLANGCASCPKLVCGRDGCNTSFCYHCKQEWHPNQTCSAASIQRNKRLVNSFNINDLIEESTQPVSNKKSLKSSQQQSNSLRAENIKECPVCASRIVKMNDGSCNHMTCSICGTEFCWLCMKEISDLHYFSPSGCTFWGKKPWSRKKKLLWQLCMLVGSPIGIILIAGIAVPAIVIGIPVWAARKLHTRLERKPISKYRKNAILTGGVLLSFVVSPIISAVALAIGIPMLMGYVYGIVPLSLCRSSGGCLSSAQSLEDLQQEFQTTRNANIQATDVISIDTALSHKLGDPSIGETSLYMSNISLETNSIGHVTTVEREDRESASNAALAGSIMSSVADDGNSTRALAGSIMSKESGYTLVPAEVHNSNQAVTNTSSQNSAASNPSNKAIQTRIQSKTSA